MSRKCKKKKKRAEEERLLKDLSAWTPTQPLVSSSDVLCISSSLTTSSLWAPPSFTAPQKSFIFPFTHSAHLPPLPNISHISSFLPFIFSLSDALWVQKPITPPLSSRLSILKAEIPVYLATVLWCTQTVWATSQTLARETELSQLWNEWKVRWEKKEVVWHFERPDWKV